MAKGIPCAPTITPETSQWRPPEKIPISQNLQETLSLAGKWWDILKNRYPRFDTLIQQATQHVDNIREKVAARKASFQYRHPKIRAQIIKQMSTKDKNLSSIIKHLNTFVPTAANNNIEDIITQFQRFLLQQPDELGPVDALQYVELKFILTQIEKFSTAPRVFPSTVKWSRTETLFKAIQQKISKYLVINDGESVLPISFQGEPELDFFQRKGFLPALFLNIPFTKKWASKLIRHMDPILRNRQEHLFVLCPVKFTALFQTSNLPVSFLRYNNPLLFYRGSSFRIHSVCPVQLMIVVMNVKNWSWNINNDLMGNFHHVIPPMPPQPHLEQHALAPSHAKIQQLKQTLDRIPTVVSTQINSLKEEALIIKGSLKSSLALNSLMTDRTVEQPLTIDKFYVKLETKPYFPEHEQIRLRDYFKTDRHKPRRDSMARIACTLCNKYGHSRASCSLRLPEWHEFGLKCPMLEVTYEYIINLPRIMPLRGELTDEVLLQIQRPLLWALQDAFWQGLHVELTQKGFHINELFAYYGSIRRMTAFGIGRQWALGATQSHIIRLIFGMIIPYGNYYKPLEFVTNTSPEEKEIIRETIQPKLNTALVVKAHKHQVRSILSHRLVQEATKNRLIIHTFHVNDIEKPPSSRLPTAEMLRGIHPTDLCLTVDLAQAFEHAPVAEISLQNQAIALSEQETYVVTGILTGSNGGPHHHHISLGMASLNCSINLKYVLIYVDDIFVSVSKSLGLSLALFLENLNESHIMISTKIPMEITNLPTFLGKIFSAPSSLLMPTETNYCKLLLRMYELVANPQIISIKLLMSIKGKIESMLSRNHILDSSSINRLVSQTILTLRTHITEDYDRLLNFEVTLSEEVITYFTTALDMLLCFENSCQKLYVETDKDLIYVATDAGETAGGGLIIYFSKNTIPEQLKGFLNANYVVFDESKRTILGTSSTSREQNCLLSYLKDVKPFFTKLHELGIDFQLITVGDNQGLTNRLKTGVTTNVEEQHELRELISLLKTIDPHYIPKWRKRTHPLIKLCDSIPRSTKSPLQPSQHLIRKIKNTFKITQLRNYGPTKILQHLSPLTYVKTGAAPQKLAPGEVYLVFANPRLTNIKQYINIINYFTILQIDAVIGVPQSRLSSPLLQQIQQKIVVNTTAHWFDASKNNDIHWIARNSRLKIHFLLITQVTLPPIRRMRLLRSTSQLV